MKRSIATVVAASFVTVSPIAASADLKDALIGGVVGAIIQKEVSKNKRAKQSRSTGTKRKATSTRAATLNSQYSKSERIQIQTALRDLGYSVGTIDGVLGKNSRRVIGQYQAARGEAATGQLTRPQYVSLLSQTAGQNAVFASRPLGRDEVRLLQQGLQTVGYYGGAIDGSNGPNTRAALNGFLLAQGITPGQTTPVQNLVLTRNAAQLPTPVYLQQEAGVRVASVPVAAPQGQGQVAFGAQPQVQTGFAPQGQIFNPQPQQGFAAQPQPQQPLFGAQPQQQLQQNGTALFAAPQPQQQQPFAQPQQQPVATGLFAAPQPQGQQQPLQQQPFQQQQVAPAQTPQQNLFAPQPQQPQQQPTATGLFATVPQGGAQQPLLPQAGTAQAPASTLDIFTGTQQPVQPQPNQVAGQ